MRYLFVLPMLICAASAETLYMQTAAGGTPLFTDGSRVEVAGINDTPSLTLNGPAVVSELYSVDLQPTAGTKSNGSATLSDNITLVEDPEFSSNALASPFTLTQLITESVTAGTATFSASASGPFVIALTTGHYLIITPFANANLGSNPIIDADFQLTSTLPTPEPSTFALAAAGLLSVAIVAFRRATC